MQNRFVFRRALARGPERDVETQGRDGEGEGVS